MERVSDQNSHDGADRHDEIARKMAKDARKVLVHGLANDRRHLTSEHRLQQLDNAQQADNEHGQSHHQQNQSHRHVTPSSVRKNVHVLTCK